MWKNRSPLDPYEQTVVDSGYVFVESTTNSFSFGKAENNPFKLNLFLPSLHFFKVNKGHPLRVTSCSSNHLKVHPARRGEKRMIGQIVEDKQAWDITTFMLVPNQVDLGKGSSWRKLELRDSFRSTKGEVGPASLLYAAGHLDISASDGLRRYGFIPASQIKNQLFYWLRQGGLIGGYKHPLDAQKDVGRFEVPLGTARGGTSGLIKELEKVYNCQIRFTERD